MLNGDSCTNGASLPLVIKHGNGKRRFQIGISIYRGISKPCFSHDTKQCCFKPTRHQIVIGRSPNAHRSIAPGKSRSFKAQVLMLGDPCRSVSGGCMGCGDCPCREWWDIVKLIYMVTKMDNTWLIYGWYMVNIGLWVPKSWGYPDLSSIEMGFSMEETPMTSWKPPYFMEIWDENCCLELQVEVVSCTSLEWLWKFIPGNCDQNLISYAMFFFRMSKTINT